MHPTGTKFLGLTVDYNRAARTITISYPNFIKSLLTRVRPEVVKHVETPAIYTSHPMAAKVLSSPHNYHHLHQPLPLKSPNFATSSAPSFAMR